jgi:hypothetical protein
VSKFYKYKYLLHSPSLLPYLSFNCASHISSRQSKFYLSSISSLTATMFFSKVIFALLLASSATAIALPEPQTVTVNEAAIAAFESQLSESCNQIQSTFDNLASGIASLESDFGGAGSVPSPSLITLFKYTSSQ